MTPITITKIPLTNFPKPDILRLEREYKAYSSYVATKTPIQLKILNNSALTIQRAWLSYKDRMIFRLLKHTVCAAEFCVAHEIIKKVSPAEAELIKDRSMKHKVRFRFKGEKFPPYIVFKIFLHTEGRGYKYFSGKNLLKSSIQAGADVYRMVGERKFYQQFLEDDHVGGRFKISEEVDVITTRDYLQYSNFLDEIPVSSGGKNNYWRRLNLEDIPKAKLMYDIVDYVQSGTVSNRLRDEIEYLFQKPNTEEMRQQQLRLVSESRRSSSLSRVQPLSESQQQKTQVKQQASSSKQAPMKNENTKKTSLKDKKENLPAETEQRKKALKKKRQRRVTFCTPLHDYVKTNELSSDDGMDKEEKMFSWCQDTYINDSSS